MASDVNNGGIEQHRDGMLTDSPEFGGVVEVLVTPEEARVLNGLLNAAGFKGSDAKQVAADIQRKLEIAYPQIRDD